MYRGNYDQFVETRQEIFTDQMKRYTAEQEDIKSMKEYVARFGHGTATNARQAKSKEKVGEGGGCHGPAFANAPSLRSDVRHP